MILILPLLFSFFFPQHLSLFSLPKTSKMAPIRDQAKKRASYSVEALASHPPPLKIPRWLPRPSPAPSLGYPKHNAFTCLSFRALLSLLIDLKHHSDGKSRSFATLRPMGVVPNSYAIHVPTSAQPLRNLFASSTRSLHLNLEKECGLSTASSFPHPKPSSPPSHLCQHPTNHISTEEIPARSSSDSDEFGNESQKRAAKKLLRALLVHNLAKREKNTKVSKYMRKSDTGRQIRRDGHSQSSKLLRRVKTDHSLFYQGIILPQKPPQPHPKFPRSWLHHTHLGSSSFSLHSKDPVNYIKSGSLS